MKYYSVIIGLGVTVASLFWASAASATEFSADFDLRHKECLQLIAKDADLAFEEAMIWRDDGGGRRARHCEAMALFALGHRAEAANRLQELAQSRQGGSPQMRADLYAESADLWLAAGELEQANLTATKGLEVAPEHAALRIARARSYAKSGRWDYAEIDLTSAIALNPNLAEAYRLRADTRRRLGELSQAKADIDTAIELDKSVVENYVVRGEILEAIRLKPRTITPPNPPITLGAPSDQ